MIPIHNLLACYLAAWSFISCLKVYTMLHDRFLFVCQQSPHHCARNMVAEIRKRFELLLLRPADGIDDQAANVNSGSAVGSSDDVLTPGQMLLMGFNGLFEKLQLEGNALIAALDTLDTPHCWKKVDQVWEAKAIAVSNET